ncbi:hypothetical protein OPQ81_005320 [Rhizoctonia solani]|nr:hypothetical protein OPQ81_005320 [Rhizoctonia solani]
MFFCTTALLNLEKKLTVWTNKNEPTRQASDKKKRLHLVLEELLRLEPTIVQRLQTAPSNYRRTVNRDTANSLSKGQSNGRSEDMRKMANLMNDERVWSWGPLPGSLRRKELRGLNHEGDCWLRQVRHALTSDKVFDETSNGFNYPAFYDGIKQYLDAPSFASRAAALIEWWNRKIFGDIYFGPEEPQESQEFGTLAALLAEVEGDCDGNIPGAAEREDADD